VGNVLVQFATWAISMTDVAITVSSDMSVPSKSPPASVFLPKNFPPASIYSVLSLPSNSALPSAFVPTSYAEVFVS
jgi:hypothetical protein